MFLLSTALAADFEVGAGVQHDLGGPLPSGVGVVVRVVATPWYVEVGGFGGLTPQVVRPVDEVLARAFEDINSDTRIVHAGDIGGIHVGVGWGDAARVERRLTGSPVVAGGLELRRVFEGTLAVDGDAVVLTEPTERFDSGPYAAAGVALAWGRHLGLRLFAGEHLRPEARAPQHTLTLQASLSGELLYRF